MLVDKLIITHGGALQKKYGKDFSAVVELLKKITASDKSKGLRSKYIFTDDAVTMKSCKARAVTSFRSEAQHKNAVDDLARFFKPDYLLIFGAPDIVPFQLLVNDNFIATMGNRSSDDDDDEEMIESDLPYASESVYNRKRRVQHYINPSRVIGRLPDVPGKADLAYLTKIVNTAINWKPLAVFPKKLFSLSTATWNHITDRIILEALGIPHTSFTSPARKEKTWKKKELTPLVHLINCHGGDTDHRFWGEHAQTGEVEPASFNSVDLHKKLRTGTIAVAECCFGGQLFEPNPALQLQMSICNSYLFNGAIGYLGSTCSSFGAVNGTPHLYNADLMAKYFLRHLLNGASLGRAFLQTRQEYFSKFNQPDPVDYKTLAQFNFFGDPSLHFFLLKSKSPKATDSGAYFPPNRKGRRAELEVKAGQLKNTVSSLKPVSHAKTKALKTETKAILRKYKLPAAQRGKTFAIQLPDLVVKGSKSTGRRPTSSKIDLKYSVYSTIKKIKKNGVLIKKQRVLILRELNGQVVEQKLVVSK